jgi:hypothetical protein
MLRNRPYNKFAALIIFFIFVEQATVYDTIPAA